MLSVFFSTVCSGSVDVKVAPKVEVLKGETAKLPCTYMVSPPSSTTVVEWYYIVSNFLYIKGFFVTILIEEENTFGSESSLYNY